MNRITKVISISIGVIIVAVLLFSRFGEDTSRSSVPKVYAATEEPIVIFELPKNIAYGPELLEKTSVSVHDARGADNTGAFEVEIVDDAVAVKPKKNMLKPGKYHVEGKVETEKGIRDFSQDFYWGVLALNPNKSVYHSGETGNIALAVLDDEGDMVCDAEVELRIENQELGVSETLSTKEGSIVVNEECRMKKVTNKPDYETQYQFGEEGIYTMELTAVTERGERTIVDYVEVKNDNAFDVERETATRIYPVYDYPVTITVIPREDFKGTVTEAMPNIFGIPEIHNSGLYATKGDKRVITWHVDWKAGETYELSYIYKSPEISPQFYLLGPLQFIEAGEVVYEDNRPWQIAVDAIAFDNSAPSTIQYSTSGYSWNYTVGASGSNKLLFVGVSLIDSSTGDRTVNSVTYNGVSMTKIREDDNSSAVTTAIFYLENPATGTNSVSMSFAGVNNGAVAGAISLTGVDQDNPLDNHNGGTSGSVSVTTVADNAWVLDTYAQSGNSTDPSVSGATEAWNVAGASNTNGGGSYYGPKTPAGSTTITWSPGSTWAHSAASFKPYVNNTPTITSVTDSPDPVVSGNSVSFSVDWNDADAGENIKVKICKTDSLTNQNCDGGSWASSTSFTTSDPEAPSYTTSGGDVGTNNYYAFVCDDGAACSSSTSGTFTVNSALSLSSVTDTPDPTNIKRSVTFIVDWDGGAGTSKAKICKTDSLTSQNCDGGYWASSTDFTAHDPIKVVYDIVGGDAGQTRNYYAFVCDADATCTSSGSGTFSINELSDQPNILIRKGVKIK